MGRSSVSYPEALMIQTFACFLWDFSCIGVCLSMYCGGVVSVLEGSLLIASARVLLSAGICLTLIIYLCDAFE